MVGQTLVTCVNFTPALGWWDGAGDRVALSQGLGYCWGSTGFRAGCPGGKDCPLARGTSPFHRAGCVLPISPLSQTSEDTC